MAQNLLFGLQLADHTYYSLGSAYELQGEELRLHEWKRLALCSGGSERAADWVP